MRVLVSLPDRQNEFQVLQAWDARKTATRLGIQIEVLDAGGSPVQQVHDLLKALHDEPPTAVVVEPISEDSLAAVARKVVSQGIGWWTLNSSLAGIEDLRREHPRVPLCAIGSDQVEIGRIQGRQIRALAPRGSHVLYVHGPASSSAARERYEGFREIVGDDVRITVVDGRWTESSAEVAVRSWLHLKTWEHAPVQAVAAQDDSMARGARAAVDALNDPRWADVEFLGIDGVPECGQRLVDDRRLAATVIMPSNTGPALLSVDSWQKSGQLPPRQVRLKAESYPLEVAVPPRARVRKSA